MAKRATRSERGDEVDCEVTEIERKKDGVVIPSLCAECSKCDHRVVAYGQSGASMRYALAKLRDTCPREEGNFYTSEYEPEED